MEIWYSVVGPRGAWINDMVGNATFSSEGIATYDYDMNYFGESGTVRIELKENGIEVFQDDFDGLLLNERQK